MALRWTRPTACRAADHADLGARPGEHEVGAEVLGVHGDRSRRRRPCAAPRSPSAPRAPANARSSPAPWRITPACSWRVPGRKPGVSTRTTSGSPKRAAAVHEAGGLLGRGGVDDPAQVARLVGDHAHRPAVDAGEGGDHVARPARRDLEQAAAVRQSGGPRRARRRPCGPRRARTRQGHRARARRRARAPGGGRPTAAGGPAGRGRPPPLPRRRAAVRWQTPLRECTRGPPSSSLRDGLAGHLLDHSGAGQEHARALGHHHEVGQGGGVGAAPGRRCR